MRSPVGAALVVVNVVMAVVLVLLLIQTIGLRGDLEAARTELSDLRAQVDGVERGVPISELSFRLAELEDDIQAWVLAFSDDVAPGASPGSGTGGGAASGEILDRLDEVLDRIDALEERLDEICQNVPVC
jgi:hypothetical protein